ncbi:DnaD domain protein [Enterococcus sp. BWT-B8]|uniref:replication initiation and membrane attachment family protein n=1 Tax=Enterococcus sp. BWT-B8 TaxID=2885157 RepID=UPI001E2D2DCB|nr:DnaD domain protein [Enterococcus sp. BWT-B8]MCB5950956.1 DnaD domain protein [Enterococcus sp. BWT-B8]
MTNNRKEIQPKNIFKVLVNHPFSDLEKDILIFLYQPIVGANAFSLFLTLLGEVKQSGLSDSLFHRELNLLLDLSTTQLEEARAKLEGIGLLDTFVKEDAELDWVYVFRLNHPEAVEAFFKDEVLALTLLNRVGQKKFDQLFERFQPEFMNFAGYENISCGYQDVYSFKEEQLIAEGALLENLKQAFKDPVPVRTQSVIDEARFDWSFFVSQVERFGLKISNDNRDLKEEIYLFNSLYGIDELEMLEFIKETFDYQTNEIDRAALKRAITRHYSDSKPQKAVQVKRNERANLTEEEQRSYRFNSLKKDGFSDEDIRTILDSEAIPPMTYLAAIKQQTGGFEIAQERYIIEYLVKRSGLPNSVINILISYVLIIQKQATLKAEYVYTIANDWAKKEIFSPEKAMSYLKTKQEENLKRRNNKGYSSNRKQPVIRKETLPDWVANPVPEEKLSKEEQEKLDKEMEEFLRRRGER